jgi:hypothetical protein
VKIVLFLINKVKIFHIQMVSDEFYCYFLFTSQVNYQGDLLDYFTMLMF